MSASHFVSHKPGDCRAGGLGARGRLLTAVSTLAGLNRDDLPENFGVSFDPLGHGIKSYYRGIVSDG